MNHGFGFVEGRRRNQKKKKKEGFVDGKREGILKKKENRCGLFFLPCA